jgi:hypothetical protein
MSESLKDLEKTVSEFTKLHRKIGEQYEELTRLKALNKELVEALQFVCDEICSEKDKEECPDGYSRNCDVLKVLTKAEGEGE